MHEERFRCHAFRQAALFRAPLGEQKRGQVSIVIDAAPIKFSKVTNGTTVNTIQPSNWSVTRTKAAPLTTHAITWAGLSGQGATIDNLDSTTN